MPSIPRPEYLRGEAGVSGWADHDFFVARTAAGAGNIPAGPTWTEIVFEDQFGEDFVSQGVIIVNRSGTTEFSWDGVRLGGQLAGAEHVTFDYRHKRKLYVRGSGGVSEALIWAW